MVKHCIGKDTKILFLIKSLHFMNGCKQYDTTLHFKFCHILLRTLPLPVTEPVEVLLSTN